MGAQSAVGLRFPEGGAARSRPCLDLWRRPKDLLSRSSTSATRTHSRPRTERYRARAGPGRWRPDSSGGAITSRDGLGRRLPQNDTTGEENRHGRADGGDAWVEHGRAGPAVGATVPGTGQTRRRLPQEDKHGRGKPQRKGGRWGCVGRARAGRSCGRRHGARHGRDPAAPPSGRQIGQKRCHTRGWRIRISRPRRGRGPRCERRGATPSRSRRRGRWSARRGAHRRGAPS